MKLACGMDLAFEVMRRKFVREIPLTLFQIFFCFLISFSLNNTYMYVIVSITLQTSNLNNCYYRLNVCYTKH